MIFQKRKKKWGLKDIKVGVLSYEQRKEKWRRKVGE